MADSQTNKCIIFSAPSGAGKTTILKELLKKPELKLEFSISATTRKPRSGEVNGKDYYFISPDEFRENIKDDKLIEFEEVYTDTFYGTLKSELDRIWQKGNIVAFDVDVKGGLNLKKIIGEKAFAIFVMPPSVEVLANRLRGRGTETEEVIKQRLSRSEFELSFSTKFDKTIINDSLEKAVDECYREIMVFVLGAGY